MKMYINKKSNIRIVCNVLVLASFLVFFASFGTGCDFLDSLPFIGKKKPAKTVEVSKDRKPAASQKAKVAVKEDTKTEEEQAPPVQLNELQKKINEVRERRKEYYTKIVPSVPRDAVFDPFVSILNKEEQTSIVETKAPVLPLQKLKISEITLVAIISNGNKKLALVEDNAHFSYIIKKDTLVGSEGGRVLNILPDEVVVRYNLQTIDGLKEITKRLKLRPSEGDNT